MAKVRFKNVILRRVLLIIGVIIAVTLVALYVFHIYNKTNYLAYDLGIIQKPDDSFLTNYEDYLSLIKKYNIAKNLKESDFNNNYYIVSFQEYDKCSESDYKTVESISYDNDININMLVHNKCGWCKKHIALHLIKIDKISLPKKINYNYKYEKQLECGQIK